MEKKHRDILAAATDVQRRYVMCRVMGARTAGEASHQLGLHRSTAYKWDNLSELEEVVIAIQIDQIEGAKWALSNLSVEAVKALREGLGERRNRVSAANSILDRAGIPKQSAVDVTSGGDPLPAPTIKEVVVKLPEDG